MDADAKRVLYNIRKIAAGRRFAPSETAQAAGTNFGAGGGALSHRDCDTGAGVTGDTQTFVYM